jgi:biopolymer transport protein ExbD
MAMKIATKEKASADIPSSSMPDIVFILLIFFMVSTVFEKSKGLKVNLPTAKKIEKLEGKRNVSYVWIDRAGRVMVDDILIRETSEIRRVVYEKLVDNPRIIVSLKVDQQTRMSSVTTVQEELREAQALRINYSAKFE